MKAKIKEITAFELLQHNSENFLVEPLPDNWEDFDDELKDEILRDSACSLTKHMTTKDLFELIKCSARCLEQFLSEKGVVIVKPPNLGLSFKLDIKCENTAFSDSPASEVARVLRETAAKLERDHSEGVCRDYSGNFVGKFAFTKGDTER